MKFLKKYTNRNIAILKRPIIIILLALSLMPINILALEVYYFNIQGLRLNMNLDNVILQFNINNVRSSKDKYGLINGYEIVKMKNDMKLVLNFTGDKRLYRIDFTDQYLNYRNNSVGILELLKQKYGTPTFENVEVDDGTSKNIRACWGNTCNRFTPSTPALKSIINYETGRLKLTLVDNRIFNKDWKKYKDAYNARSGIRSFSREKESKPSF